MAVSCVVYSSTLKLEIIYFSETSIDFQQTTRCYNPEDKTLHSHRCDNLISNLHFELGKNELVTYQRLCLKGAHPTFQF
jgi:hypothetical protein